MYFCLPLNFSTVDSHIPEGFGTKMTLDVRNFRICEIHEVTTALA